MRPLSEPTVPRSSRRARREGGNNAAGCMRSPSSSWACYGPIHRPHTVADLNQSETRNAAIFSADFLSHSLVSQTTARHTLTQCGFCRFWFNRLNTAKWLYGCLQGNRLRTISSSNLYGKSSDTLTKFWICSFFFFFFCHSPFFLSFSVSPCQIHGVSVRFSWDDPCLHN